MENTPSKESKIAELIKYFTTPQVNSVAKEPYLGAAKSLLASMNEYLLNHVVASFTLEGEIELRWGSVYYGRNSQCVELGENRIYNIVIDMRPEMTYDDEDYMAGNVVFIECQPKVEFCIICFTDATALGRATVSSLSDIDKVKDVLKSSKDIGDLYRNILSLSAEHSLT